MSEGSLFNSGFLGANFNWWLGQIADDTYWRDNISPGNFDDPSQISGWGRRYKVRIIGLHDQEEEVIPSEQLPWAHIMYPVTAGGGQASAFATANLRQGNFVFGFFLDGADQQVPVIMGVLGNNTQTALSMQIGKSDANYGPTSGFAQSLSGTPNQTIKVPDEAIATNPQPNPTIEQPDNPNQLSLAKVKRQELYDEVISMLNPCDPVGSAMKAIQDKLDWLVKKIDQYLKQASSYIDTAVGYIQEIQSVIANASCTIAKYLKIHLDKLLEYTLKSVNSAIAPTIQTLPPNKRQFYITLKDTIIELTNCLYNKIINSLCGQIEKFLNDTLNINTKILPEESDSSYTVSVPPCAVEDLVGNVLKMNMNEIDDNTNNVLSAVNSFLSDISSELTAAGSIISNINSKVDLINSNIVSALNFENIKINVFGCDLKPVCASTDRYTLQSGGQINVNSPSLTGVYNSMS